MRLLMLGTRGVPARYGGFETAVEEIGQRLAASGHHVTVYCRTGDRRQVAYKGMDLVHLPTVRSRSAETLAHTALSVWHAVRQRPRADVAIVFNSANSVLLPILRLARIPVAVHVDGLEWQRAKWSGLGRRYYQLAEALAVGLADALVADAEGIAKYYAEKFAADAEILTYGAPLLDCPGSSKVEEMGLEAGKYHLAVARLEPENHVDLIVDGYASAEAKYPLVVVGATPYETKYTQALRANLEATPGVVWLGSVWDQQLLDELWANCTLYLHGHSVGGTNPALLRAMGAEAPVAAYDVTFNREVLAESAQFFSGAQDVARVLLTAENDRESYRRMGADNRAKAERKYAWKRVSEGYEGMLWRLANGQSLVRGRLFRATSSALWSMARWSARQRIQTGASA